MNITLYFNPMKDFPDINHFLFILKTDEVIDVTCDDAVKRYQNFNDWPAVRIDFVDVKYNGVEVDDDDSIYRLFRGRIKHVGFGDDGKLSRLLRHINIVSGGTVADCFIIKSLNNGNDYSLWAINTAGRPTNMEPPV